MKYDFDGPAQPKWVRTQIRQRHRVKTEYGVFPAALISVRSLFTQLLP